MTPVSDSCTVRHSRSREREARASTTMTQAGLSRRARAWATRLLSMPVEASTPGAAAATGRRSPKCSGTCSTRWRVTSRWSTARGPIRSGVTARLPRPMTRAGPCWGSRGRRHSDTADTARAKAPSSRRSRPSSSTVTYTPWGLPRARAPSGLEMVTVFTAKPSRTPSSARTPVRAAPAWAPSRQSWWASTARSVRRCAMKDSPLYQILWPLGPFAPIFCREKVSMRKIEKKCCNFSVQMLKYISATGNRTGE